MINKTFLTLFTGIVSGIAVFCAQIWSDKYDSSLFTYLNGTVFGVISGVYFVYLSKGNFLIKYILWIITSFVSFFLAVLSMMLVAESKSGSVMLGFSGLVGVAILIVGFRILFSKLQSQDYASLLIVAALIPALLMPIIEVSAFGYLALYVLWQTSAVVVFSRALLRSKYFITT